MKKYRLAGIVLSLAVVVAWCTTGVQTVQAAQSTGSKAVYTIKKYKNNYSKTCKSGGKLTAKYVYQMPQLKGSSDAVKKINRALKKDYQASLDDRKTLFEYAKEADFSYDMSYSAETKVKVTYNKNGYVSFLFSYDWFAGGPHPVGSRHSMTFRLKDGKKLSVSDVIAGNKETVKNKITKKCLNQMKKEEYSDIDGIRSGLKNTKISKFNFYLKNGKVVIYFNPYDLNMPYAAGVAPDVVLKGTYE